MNLAGRSLRHFAVLAALVPTLVGAQAVQAPSAVAETGTLAMYSGPAHPSTLNFVPETHVVVLPASRVVKSYEDVFDAVRELAADPDSGRGGLPPRTVNFVTGPSRSGDIEQTLLLGAHGPRRLHIVIVEDGADNG